MENKRIITYNPDYGKKIFIADIKRFCSKNIDEVVRIDAVLVELPNKRFVEIARFNTYDDLCKIIQCSDNDINLDIFLGTSTNVEGGLYVDEESLLSYDAYINKPENMSNADFKRLIYGKYDHRKKQAK